MYEGVNVQKIMKPSEIKTVVVQLTADNVFEFNVDTDIFDDPFLEAATRAVERIRKQRHGIIRPVSECWDKLTPKKPYLYNSYHILVNASCYAKAEQLREKFKMQTGGKVDLSLEPIRS